MDIYNNLPYDLQYLIGKIINKINMKQAGDHLEDNFIRSDYRITYFENHFKTKKGYGSIFASKIPAGYFRIWLKNNKTAISFYIIDNDNIGKQSFTLQPYHSAHTFCRTIDDEGIFVVNEPFHTNDIRYLKLSVTYEIEEMFKKKHSFKWTVKDDFNSRGIPQSYGWEQINKRGLLQGSHVG